MLELNKKLAKEFGEEVVQRYKVRSKSEKGKFRIVEILSSGEFFCDCPSYKECRHIKLVKKKLNK